MKEIAEKLRDLERELKDEKGPFAYFALVREGEAPDRWDLVVSAPWISADRMEGVRLIAERLKQKLAPRSCSPSRRLSLWKRAIPTWKHPACSPPALMERSQR